MDGMAHSTFTIAEARPEDIADILRIMGEGQLSGAVDTYDATSAPDYDATLAHIAAQPGEFVLIARDAASGIALGIAQAQLYRTFKDRGRPRLTLHALFVAAAARGRGIGAALLGAVEARGRELGARRVYLLSHKDRRDAHRFYRANGYSQSHEGIMKVLEA